MCALVSHSTRLRAGVFFLGLALLSAMTHGQHPDTHAAQGEDAHAVQASLAQPLLNGNGPITEEQIKQELLGKTFYLRGGYMENTLHFDAEGKLDGNSPQASHTLSIVEITRVRMDKHKLQLEGVRYGLHFLGALPSEEQAQAFDRVRLTSKKKPLVITIGRERVAAAKKEKKSKKEDKRRDTKMQAESQAAQPAAARPDEHVASEAHANRALRQALDHILARGIDDRMIDTLPDYWKLYYNAAARKTDYRPNDARVLRPSQVDRKARLLQVFEPPSNEFAQNNGVAGMALYHVVVMPEGKAGEIAVGRPIGFGLDENAVESIRKASFEPALKDGKPVAEVLDLVVQFRIYSKRTATQADPARQGNEQPAPPSLPGPYSVQHP